MKGFQILLRLSVTRMTSAEYGSSIWLRMDYAFLAERFDRVRPGLPGLFSEAHPFRIV